MLQLLGSRTVNNLAIQSSLLVVVAIFSVSLVLPIATVSALENGKTNNNGTVSASETRAALQDTPGILGASDQIVAKSDIDSALTTETQGTIIDVPKNANQGVTFGSSSSSKIEIELPNAEDSATAKTVANGVIAYTTGDGSSNAVQATEDGAVRMLTIIDNPAAPTSYSYKTTVPNGGHIEVTSGGGAIILDGNNQPIATVDAPWAKDANGKSVETWFTTDGQSLTQHVKHNVPGVAYPVTADPRYSWAWHGVTIYLSRNETKAIGVGAGAAASYFGWAGIYGVAAYAVAGAAQWAANRGYCLAIYKNYASRTPSTWTYRC